MSETLVDQLTHLKVGDGPISIPLSPQGMVIGSGEESHLRLDDNGIEPRHARVVRLDGTWWLEPLAGGVRLNGKPLKTLSVLHPGDQVQVGQTILTMMSRGGAVATRVAEPAGTRLRIGRSAECELVLDSPLVSRVHAELFQTPEGMVLRDLGSANGTFVEGRPITETRLEPRQMVYIGPSRLLFDGRTLKEYGTRGAVRVQVQDLCYDAPVNRKRLLTHITACVRPGEFVALVGTSGAGKSTMLGLVSGQREPTEGHVLYNGMEASANLALFRPLIGYVPQDDIVHRELPVEAALRYSARLRLPADTGPDEIQRRIDFVLATMDLSERRHNPIYTLSGGQRKRVSIAVELLTEPSLFFLDEPTSGLDPGLEKRAMQLMSALARQGRTVILITHATQNIVLCDKVLFLAPGGRMVYYGPPREALQHFGVEDFADIYLRIGTVLKGQEWEERFRASEDYRTFVEQDRGGLEPPVVAHPSKTVKKGPSSWLDGVRQFQVLLERYAHLVVSDRLNLMLLLAQAPIIGAILALLFEPGLFALNQEWSSSGKFPIKEGPTLLFLLMVSCIFFGSINSCREIVKELPILRRERLVNLQLFPYFLSKVLVLSWLGIAQAFILLGVVMLRINLQLSFTGVLEVYGFMLGAYVGGTLLGLLLSSISSSAEQATTLVSVLLIVQLALSGAFIKPEEMLGPVRFLSSLSLSRWAFAGIGSVANLNSRFEELGMGWITGDFYFTPWQVWTILGPLLGLYFVVALAALRWREARG